MDYVIHTADDAPAAARASLERVRRKYTFIPHLAATMAQSPGLLHAYLEVEHAFRTSSLSAVEQEVVALTVSVRNGCRYCVSGHSMLATMAGLEGNDLEALRTGVTLVTPRLEALRHFTRALLDAHGVVAPQTVDAFLAAGYTREDTFAVILGIAFKTLSNLTHHVQPVPLDAPLQPFEWAPDATPAATRVLVSGWTRPDGKQALAEYQTGAAPIMSRHGGRPVFKSSPAAAYAGSAPDLVVLIEFPSSRSAAAAFGDPDYLSLLPLREQAFARLDVSELG